MFNAPKLLIVTAIVFFVVVLPIMNWRVVMKKRKKESQKDG